MGQRRVSVSAAVVTLACWALLAAGSPVCGQHEGHVQPGVGGEPPPARAVPLYGGLGTAHRPITTYRPDAQDYFDQGLRWMHAFNLEEAEASFREALARDPTCPMCAWGVAFSLGPHINLPALPERTVAAAAAIAQADKLAAARPAAATGFERALIAAMSKRYSDPAPATAEAQAKLDAGYAEAMREVARRYPEDAEVRFLLAEALMDLHPWDLYAPESGEPREWTGEIVSTIAAGLKLDSRHPGLHHLHIHALEASKTPERAVESADFLRRAMPDAAHMVHMPGHIYLRVGRFADAALANERAIAVDGSYLRRASPNVAFYRMIYAPHNVDFLAAAAAMQGRSAAAMLATRAAQTHLDPEMLRQMPGFDLYLGRAAWMLLRFGRYAQVLEEPLPPADFPYALATVHAARGLALLRLGRRAEAEVEQRAMQQAAARVPPDATEGLNQASLLLAIPTHLLAGEMALARGEVEAGLVELAMAEGAEDALRYDEPSDWHFPVRHLLGAIELRLGNNGHAESTFREDLRRNPENGWALAGLEAALERQGKRAEAEAVRARRERAWADADLGLERLVAPPVAPSG
jgi:tetratricopeptide (TPR) repeat protein